jgi:hypothetical protein
MLSVEPISASMMVLDVRAFANGLHEHYCRPRHSGDLPNSSWLPPPLTSQYRWGQITLSTSQQPQKFLARKNGEL